MGVIKAIKLVNGATYCLHEIFVKEIASGKVFRFFSINVSAPVALSRYDPVRTREKEALHASTAANLSWADKSWRGANLQKPDHLPGAIQPALSALDYIPSDEALTQGLGEISEIDKDGSVPELKLTNKSEKMIFILDGKELVRAKQNRIVNTTLLIPKMQTVVIPVSCVEQGRWAYKTESFFSEERLASPALRAMKA